MGSIAVFYSTVGLRSCWDYGFRLAHFAHGNWLRVLGVHVSSQVTRFLLIETGDDANTPWSTP